MFGLYERSIIDRCITSKYIGLGGLSQILSSMAPPGRNAWLQFSASGMVFGP